MNQPRAMPSLFIGSSTESLPIAYAIQQNLEHDCEPTVWTQGVFALTQPTLADLLRCLVVFDFGVFVLTPDDVTKMRNTTIQVARDNVVFELGLFIGALGASRTFMLLPRGVAGLHLPSDLAGITPATYDASRSDGNLKAALGPPCTDFRNAIARLGSRESSAASIAQVLSRSAFASSQPSAVSNEPELREKNRTLVVAQLHDFIRAAENFSHASHGASFPDDELDSPMVEWKMRVGRFIDRALGPPEAKSFLGLRSTLGSAVAIDHFRSALRNHLSFLRTLCEEVERDEEYPLVFPQRPSGKLLFGSVGFTYGRK